MRRQNKKEEIINTLGIDHAQPRKKSSKRRYLWILVALPIVLMMLMSLSFRARRLQVHYKTAPVQRGDLTITIQATGNLSPIRQVEVGTELSGILKTVEADFNDQVKIGQPLARLDDTKYQAAVLESKAALSSAKAKLMQVKASLVLINQNVKRMQQVFQLSGGKAPAKGEMEKAETELRRAKAEENAANAAIQQAEALLKINESDLSKTTIYSPINGVVLKRNVDPGQTVAASLTAPVLFTLAEDLASMELQVDVDEADVGLVQEGQDATFTVEAYAGRTFTARITQLRYNAQILNGVVTYPALLSVDNTDLVLRPGMTATVKIVAKNVPNSILIPNAALRFKPREQGRTANAKRRLGLFRMFARRSSAAAPKAEETQLKDGQSNVWLLLKNQLVPVAVSTGLSNDAYTIMTEGNLQPGVQVVVDMTQWSRKRRSGASGPL